MKPIYLDNNATTRPNHNMLASAVNFYENCYGNPSSQHAMGQEAKNMLETARGQVADCFDCDPEEIIFTSGGTEANNIAIRGSDMVSACSTIEHSSVYNLCDYKIPVNRTGFLNIYELEKFLEKQDHCSIISIMHSNNETGLRLATAGEISDLKDKYDFIYHMDAVAAFGKTSGNFKAYTDLISISGHKIGAPKGIGALYISNEIKERMEGLPLFLGGAHEQGLRPGTQNIFGAYCLGYMCDKIKNDIHYQDRIWGIGEIRDTFEKLLEDVSRRPWAGSNTQLQNVSSLYFPAIKDLDLFLDMLSAAGVYASGGSACQSGFSKPSRVIEEMIDKGSPESLGTVRFSFGVDNTMDEVVLAAEIIKDTITKIGAL